MTDYTTKEPYPKWAALVIFLLMCVTLAYFSPSETWNGKSRLGLTFALVEEGRLQIDSYQNSPEMQTGDKSQFNGHFYSDKAPGPALLGAIVYASFRWIAHAINLTLTLAQKIRIITFVVIGIPTALATALVFLLCMDLGGTKTRSFIATASIGLGTMLMPYGQVFFSHSLTAALLFISFFLCFRMRNKPRYCSWYVSALIGLALGAAFIGEYTAAVACIPLCAYFVLSLIQSSVPQKMTRLLAFVAAALLPVAVLLVYNQLCFGNPFSIGYEHNSDVTFKEAMSHGIMGIGMPKLNTLLLFMVHPAQGLFWQSPILILSFVGLACMLRLPRYRLEAIVITLICIGFILLNSGYYMWWGGSIFAPRLLTPMLPFLALPLIFLPRFLNVPSLVLMVASILQMLIPAASTIGPSDSWVVKLSTSGLFSYSTIYSVCLQELLSGQYNLNLGQAVFGLRDVWSLIPLALIIVGVSYWFLKAETPRPNRLAR